MAKAGCIGWGILSVPAGIISAVGTFYAIRPWICRGDQQLHIATGAFVIGAAVAFFGMEWRSTRRVGRSLLLALIVLIVVFLPVAVAVPGLDNAVDASRRNKTKKEMETIGAAIETYRADHGRYPAVESIKGRDAWGNPYLVRVTPDGWELRSCGACGVRDKDGVVENDYRYYRFQRDLVLRDGIRVGESFD